VVQHVITNLCMGLQADQLHGMVVSSPTVQLPELTVSLQAQSSLDPPIMSVESQAPSPETSTVAQTSHNTYTIPVPPEPTSAHIQQDYVNQSVSIDDQSSRELNNNNSENNFTLIDRFLDTISKPMVAIKMLIEQEAKKQKTSAVQKKAAVAPAMEA